MSLESTFGYARAVRVLAREELGCCAAAARRLVADALASVHCGLKVATTAASS